MMRSLAIRHQIMMEPPSDKLMDEQMSGGNRKRRKRLLQFRKESTDFSVGQSQHQICQTGEKPSTRRLPYKFTPLKHIQTPKAEKLSFKQRESQYHLRGRKITTHGRSSSKQSLSHSQHKSINSASHAMGVSKREKRKIISRQLNLPIFGAAGQHGGSLGPDLSHSPAEL